MIFKMEGMCILKEENFTRWTLDQFIVKRKKITVSYPFLLKKSTRRKRKVRVELKNFSLKYRLEILLKRIGSDRSL